MGCKYCCEKAKILDENVVIKLEKNSLHVSGDYDGCAVRINYCPMCGRQLSEEEVKAGSLELGRKFKWLNNTFVVSELSSAFEYDTKNDVVVFCFEESRVWLLHKNTSVIPLEDLK